MVQTARIPAEPDPDDTEAGLSVETGDGDSIVDGLLAMPDPEGDSGSLAWDRAMLRRLETRLAERIRSLVEKPRSRDAA